MSLLADPAWSRAHARIMQVEPLLSMTAEQRGAFLRDLASVDSPDALAASAKLILDQATVALLGA